MSKSFEDIYRGINYDLINHYEQGVADERNRIIKLLEDKDSVSAAWAISVINEEKE
jgi:hypothetical protein